MIERERAERIGEAGWGKRDEMEGEENGGMGRRMIKERMGRIKDRRE